MQFNTPMPDTKIFTNELINCVSKPLKTSKHQDITHSKSVRQKKKIFADILKFSGKLLTLTTPLNFYQNC